MSLATLIVIVAAAGVVAWSYRSGLGWVNPANIYAAVWTVAVALYQARLFPFYELAPTTWALVGAAAASFVIASIWGGSRPGRPRPSTAAPTPIQADPYPVIRLFLVIGLCGSAVFLWRVDNYSGLWNYFRAPQPTYQALTLRAFDTSHLFLYYFGVVGTIVFGYAVMLLRRRPRAIDLALLGAFLVAMVLAMERTHFLWVVASWAFLRLAPVRGNRTLPQVVVTLAVALAVALPYYLVVGRWLGKTPATYSTYIRMVAQAAATTPPAELPAPAGGTLSEARALAKARSASPDTPPGSDRSEVPATPRPAGSPNSPPPAQLSLLMPGGPLYRLSVLYVAVASPLPTFNHVVVNPEPLRYGRMTLHPFFRLAQRLGVIPGGRDLTIYPDVPTPYPANAYTYLYEFYLDFGWLGVILLPAVVGWVAGVALARTRDTVGLNWWPLVLCQLHGMILWSPFANRFVVTVNVYMVVLLVVGVALVTLLARRAPGAAGGRSPSGAVGG